MTPYKTKPLTYNEYRELRKFAKDKNIYIQPWSRLYYPDIEVCLDIPDQVDAFICLIKYKVQRVL